MRKLSTEKRAMILECLCEGTSVAATCRMLRVSKVTVLRLLADAGTLAAEYHDLMVRDLQCKRVQVDELWSFVGAKQRQVDRGADAEGSVWTWTAIDSDSKLLISYLVGQRDGGYALQFAYDMADRIESRFQLTSDGLAAYLDAIGDAFGEGIDYAMLVKIYGAERPDHARYSPAVCTGARKDAKIGNPDPAYISTSHVERQNLTVRMQNRRFTRLTNAFSKSLSNHEHSVALMYFHYNFCRKHQTIKTTPAVMAGVADKVWTMVDFVEMLEAEEKARGGRITEYLASPGKSSDSK
ncbi:MAG: IS1 family transposase [Planctomycetota bacterium]